MGGRHNLKRDQRREAIITRRRLLLRGSPWWRRSRDGCRGTLAYRGQAIRPADSLAAAFIDLRMAFAVGEHHIHLVKSGTHTEPAGVA